MPRADASMRNRDCVQHILRYCNAVEQSLREIDCSRERFMASGTYQNAIAMCILQIGELTKRLSEEFRQTHAVIPWSLIAKTRDVYVHHYGTVDFDMVWETAVHDIPRLKAFCEIFLNS